MRPRIASILIFLGIAALSFADRNVTVDDNDAAVRYSNGWSLSLQSHPLNFGGFHHLTNSKDARATFTFTGTAIYFKSPRWPYAVAANVQVDDSAPVLIDLQDYQGRNVDGQETINTADVWGMTGLRNVQHTLTVSFPPGKEWLVLDALVYTVPDATSSSTPTSTPSSTGSATRSTPSSTSSTASTSSSESASSSSVRSNNILPIALGASLGAVTLVLIVLIFLYFRRKKKDQYPSSFTANSMTSANHPGSLAGPGTVDNSMGSRVTSAYFVEPWNNPYGSASPPIHAVPVPPWGATSYQQHPYASGPSSNTSYRPPSQGSTGPAVTSQPYAGYYSVSDQKEPVRLSYVANNDPSDFQPDYHNTSQQYSSVAGSSSGSSYPYAQSQGPSKPPIPDPRQVIEESPPGYKA